MIAQPFLQPWRPARFCVAYWSLAGSLARRLRRRRWAMRRLAIGDDVVPNVCNRALARAMGIPHAPPLLQPVGLVPTLPALPASGNWGGRTAVLFQLDRVTKGKGQPPQKADHSSTPKSLEAMTQDLAFIAAWLKTGTAEAVDSYQVLGTSALPYPLKLNDTPPTAALLLALRPRRRKIAPTRSPTLRREPPMTALVQVQGVHKAFALGDTQVHALRGADLLVHAGEFAALVGASGSGKSTLLNLIGCLDEPDSGSVLLDGQDVSHLSDKARCQLRNRKIGFIFQSFNLVPVLSVAENIELPLLLHAELSRLQRAERVQQALADVDLMGFAAQVPDKLSGGQRQRVAVARALVTHPALVLADEPTANLDSETAARLVDLMVELNKKRGVTFLFSTHDEKLMRRVDRIVRIMDGQILAGEGDAP